MKIIDSLRKFWELQSFKRRHRRNLRDYGPEEAWEEINLWIGWIQECIEKNSKITSPVGHPSFEGMPITETDVTAWSQKFVSEVCQFLKGGMGKRDGNLRFAGTAGLILVSWFIACARAKALDPRRRLEERLRAHRYLRGYIALLTDAMFDVTLSTRNFPDQLWDVTMKKHVPHSAARTAAIELLRTSRDEDSISGRGLRPRSPRPGKRGKAGK